MKLGLSNPRDGTCLIERRQMQIKSAIAETARGRKGYDLIVRDEWTKRGGQLARVPGRGEGENGEREVGAAGHPPFGQDRFGF